MRIPTLDQIRDLLVVWEQPVQDASNKGVEYPVMDNSEMKSIQDRIFQK